MKHLKIYDWNSEAEGNWRLGKQIESLCQPWKEKLNLQEFFVNEGKKRIYLKLYNEMNEYTYDYFHEFFMFLKEIKVGWSYTDGRSFMIDYKNVDPKDIEMYIDANNYNL